jgi:hypothetical protein
MPTDLLRQIVTSSQANVVAQSDSVYEYRLLIEYARESEEMNFQTKTPG